MCLNLCPSVTRGLYTECRRCLRRCLRIESFKTRVYKFSSSSPCSLSAGRPERRLPNRSNENHSQTVESHRRPRSVLLGYASDGRFAWPTDRLYCCSSRRLSFFPACLVRFVSPLSPLALLTTRVTLWAKFRLPRVVFPPLFGTSRLRGGRHGRKEFSYFLYAKPRGISYPQAGSPRKFRIALKMHDAP